MVDLTNWEQVAEELERVLPKSLQPLPQQRREKLLLILQEWARTDLRQHLSMDPRPITQERINRLEKIKARACQLSNDLKQIDKRGQLAILRQMIISEGRRTEDVSQTEFSERQVQFSQVVDYLAKLGAINPKYRRLSRGRPRNIAAYLVLRDVANIFEWLTDTVAGREVDRIEAVETGPFFRFASILWPIVFRRDVAGLPAAMKNWAAWRSKYDERSALIANIALRYPTWGVFER